MKIKIIKSDFNDQTGISTIELQTNLGNFLGQAKTAEEDKPYISKYAGCRLAELRAYQQYYKELLKRKKSEANGMKQICNAISNSINATDKNDFLTAVRIAKKNYYKKLEEIRKIEKNISNIQIIISKTIEERDRYIQEKYRAKEIKE